MIRTFLGGAAFVALAAFPLVSLAAPADVSLLQSYVGNYTGKSTMNDPQTGRPTPVSCRLVLSGGSTGKVTYTGRCNFGPGSTSMTGVFSFVGDHYEAVMSSTGGMEGKATGVRHGNSISFTSRGTTTMGGAPRSVSSTLTLSGGTIRIEFSTTDSKTGKTTRGSIPFTKA